MDPGPEIDSGPGADPPTAPAPPPQDFRRVSPLTPVVRGFVFLAAALFATWRDALRGDFGYLAIGFGIALLVGVAYGAASWALTRYRIGAEELRVDTGVINRQSRRIRIDRIQGVDVVQPFVARLFRLAELRIDTAGGDREGSLAYLPLREAEAVRRTLLARRRAADSTPPGSAPGTAPADVPEPTAQPEQLLVRVPLGRLMLSAALSTETVFVVLGASFVLGAFLATGQWWAITGVGPAVGALVLVLANRVSGNYRFTVAGTESGLQVRRGLFDLTTQTLNLRRVQGVVLTEPWLWRWLGWARLDVSVAGNPGQLTGNAESSPTTLHPVGPRAEVLWLARTVLGGLDLEQVPLRPAPPAARWLAPLQGRWLAVGADPALVVSRHGLLTRSHHVAPQRRVQSVRITQGPLQRRLGLGTVQIDSPPGPVSVRALHRLAPDARSFVGYEIAAARHARGRGAPTDGVHKVGP